VFTKADRTPDGKMKISDFRKEAIFRHFNKAKRQK